MQSDMNCIADGCSCWDLVSIRIRYYVGGGRERACYLIRLSVV
jgi:hypothetical protein